MHFKNFRLLKLTPILSLITISLSSCPGGEASSLILGNKINSAIDKLNWGLEKSIVNADYRMEKNLRTLQLITTNIQAEFNKEVQRNRNFVSEEMTKNIDKIGSLIDEVKGGVLEVEDFIVLDAHNIINQVPFKKDIFLIRKINGYGTIFKENGTYNYSIIGNAFQPNKFYKVSIDDYEISEANIFLRAANQITFTLPTSVLNNKFLETSITRAKLHILSYDKKDDKNPFFEFSGEVLLLPKSPIQYNFFEFSNKPTWSDEKYYKTFSFDMGPTGEEKKWDVSPREVSVDDPTTQKFTRLVEKHLSGSHSTFTEESFTPDYKTYHVTIANQCHDCSRSFFGTLEYVKLLNVNDQERRFFESDTAKKGVLTYGVHTLSLSKEYQLFELSIIYFNGEKVFLNKERLSDKERDCYVSISKSENETLRRLSLELKGN